MCAAAFGTLVAATAAVTLSGPVAVAGDNDREHWSGRRALKVADGETQAVRLITDRSKNRWALLARQLSQPSGAPETWRLREYRRDRETGYDWAKPAAVPGEVTWFRYDQNQHGRIAAAWIRDGGLWAGSKSALTSRSGGRTDRAVMDRTRLADEVPGADPPRVYVQPRLDGDVLIDYAGTFHEYLSRPPVSCPGCDGYPRWATTPAPTAPAGVTGRPSLALLSGREVLAFWSGDPNEPGATSLRWSRRLETPTGPAWSEPQVIAAGTYELVKIVETVRGVRLVAVGPDGEVSLFDYGAQATSGSPGFGNRRDLAGPVTTGPVSVPQVVVDGFGVLTVAWRERDQVDAGLVIWQEDRPGSQYLEQPVLVPGTPHTSAATLVAAPFGSLTVVFQPDQHRRAMQFPRAVHLPAGTRQWTDPLRLESPNPPTVAASFSVGRPRLGGDVWVAANDGAGVWVHEFDAPRPGAKVTRPGRAIQRQRTYTIGWKPTWANAVDYAVRARVSKRLGWQEVAVPEGARSKTLTRPRGERRCYQARAIMVNGFRTDWSSQRCVTVRR